MNRRRLVGARVVENEMNVERRIDDRIDRIEEFSKLEGAMPAVMGFSARMGRRWRTYAETGVAYLERYEQQESWRVQGGVEYESPQRLWGDRFSWFWASDLSSWQERDWRLDTSFQAGIATHSEGRTYRLGIQVHDGRPTVSDFFQYSETSVTLGIWVDF